MDTRSSSLLFRSLVAVILVVAFVFCGMGTGQALAATKPLPKHPAPRIWSQTCNGSSCNGVNPQGSSCQSDPNLWTSPPTPVHGLISGNVMGYVVLRYSPACNANWARVEANSTAYMEAWLADSQFNHVGDVSAWCSCTPGDPPWVVWSNMWDGSLTLRACGDINSGEQSEEACTGAY